MTKQQTFRALVLLKIKIDHGLVSVPLKTYFKIENTIRQLRRELW
jgi:hypothetical protein